MKKAYIYSMQMSRFPSITLAVSSLVVFYSLNFLKNIKISLFLFFLFTLSSLSLILSFIIGRFLAQRSEAKRNEIDFRAEEQVLDKRNTGKKILSLFFFISLGSLFGTIAYLKLLASFLPPITLANMQKGEKVTLTLLGDAYPSSSAYYKVKASLSECKASGGIYSCKGAVILLIPSVFIRQNYLGSSTLQKKASKISIFSKGLIIEVEGHFAKKKKSELFSMHRFIVSKNSNISFKGYSAPLYSLRAHSRFFLSQLLYSWNSAGALLQALLTANRDFLSIEDVSNFRAAGASHVLALSGMHLAIIGGLAHFFSSLFLGRKLLKLAIMGICFVFLIFAGASPSLLRSFFMLCIIATARLLYVQVELLPTLALTFSFHVFFFPQDALTLSFSLSYLALFGILFFGQTFYNLLTPFLPDFICASLSSSLSATFATLPLLAITFGQVSLIGIISCCIISPLISLFLVLGILCIPASLIAPLLHNACGLTLNLLYTFIINVVSIFSIFPCIKCETHTALIFTSLPFMLAIVLMFLEKHWRDQRLKKLIIN